MANACNELAVMTCPHGGSITLTGKGDSKLKALSSNVLSKTTIIGAPVGVPTPCPFQSPPGTPAPCTVVVSVTGESTKLKASDQGVVLDNSTVKVTNPVLGPVDVIIISAGQTLLTASG